MVIEYECKMIQVAVEILGELDMVVLVCASLLFVLSHPLHAPCFVCVQRPVPQGTTEACGVATDDVFFVHD